MIYDHIESDQGCDGGRSGDCGIQGALWPSVSRVLKEEEGGGAEEEEPSGGGREDSRQKQPSGRLLRLENTGLRRRGELLDQAGVPAVKGQRPLSPAAGQVPGHLHPPKVPLSLPRSVKNGEQTQVDLLCTYQRPPQGPGLPAQQVFHELSWQTRGITRLGPYSLDKDSLYLNGERPSAHPCSPRGCQAPGLEGRLGL